MECKIFADDMMGQNVYVYYDPQTKKGVIVDAGVGGETALAFLEREGIEIQMILLTHAHFDHIMTLSELRSATKAPVALHTAEADLLGDSRLNLTARFGGVGLEASGDSLLEDNETLSFDSFTLRLLHTPGHTPGGVCFYDENEGLVFTGDTLFRESVGRSDFPLGDGSALIVSIREKLLTLPGNVKVYPGHGPATTIGHERDYNPFL